MHKKMLRDIHTKRHRWTETDRECAGRDSGE